MRVSKLVPTITRKNLNHKKVIVYYLLTKQNDYVCWDTSVTLAPATRSLFTNWASCGWQQVARGAVQALAHGTFQGGMMSISGGKFWNGFAAGAASSIASSLFSADLNTRNDATLGWGNSVRSSGAGMVAFGTVSGGAGAHLSGGNFWQGAVTGFTVSFLNHTFHNIQEKHKFFNRLRKHYEGKSGNDFVLSEKEFKFLVRKGDINYNKFVRVGENRYEVSINFYDSDTDLALSFGRATLSYSVVNDKKVFDGFYDRYDFDSKELGVRSYTNEAMTRTYNTLFEGKSYNIYYNKAYFTNYEKIYYNSYDIERFNKR